MVLGYFWTVVGPKTQKVGYALTFLQDAAREWWIQQIHHSRQQLLDMWDNLAEALWAHFSNHKKEMTSHTELRVIQ